MKWIYSIRLSEEGLRSERVRRELISRWPSNHRVNSCFMRSNSFLMTAHSSIRRVISLREQATNRAPAVEPTPPRSISLSRAQIPLLRRYSLLRVRVPRVLTSTAMRRLLGLISILRAMEWRRRKGVDQKTDHTN